MRKKKIVCLNRAFQDILIHPHLWVKKENFLDKVGFWSESNIFIIQCMRCCILCMKYCKSAVGQDWDTVSLSLSNRFWEHSLFLCVWPAFSGKVFCYFSLLREANTGSEHCICLLSVWGHFLDLHCPIWYTWATCN